MRATLSWNVVEDVQFNSKAGGERRTVTETTSLYLSLWILLGKYLCQIYKVSNFLPIQKVVCQAYLMRSLLAKTLAIHNL